MPFDYGQTSKQTKLIRDLINQISMLANGGDTSIEDLRMTLSRINTVYSDIDDVYVNAAKSVLQNMVDDGVFSDEERQQLANFSSIYDNPISDFPIAEANGKSFVLTGDFNIAGGKSTAEQMIKIAGGSVKTGVSGKTDYVVVGAKGSEAWGYGSFGGKIKTALDIKLTKENSIEIVTESAFVNYCMSSCPSAMRFLEDQEKGLKQLVDTTKVVSTTFSGLTHGQQEMLNLVKTGANVYLTGLGGTGKSYILDKIIEWADDEHLNVIACAPTGIAALNIGGCTIHHMLGIGPNTTTQIDASPYLEDDSPLISCDLMIIDEISMCRMDLFDYLSIAVHKASQIRQRDGYPPCQMVVVGDFFQLAPVLPNTEKQLLNKKYGHDVGHAYPFMGKEWASWNFVKVELTEAIRQRDASFVAALNACRMGYTYGLDWIERHAAKSPEDNAIILAGRNDKVDRENANNLDKINISPAVYQCVVEGFVEESDKSTLEHLELKPGARVMALVNNTETTYMNGSLGTVVACYSDCVEVKFDNNKRTTVHPHKWDITRPILKNGKIVNESIGSFTQIPLKLAYAITIHKSQGQTFDSAIIYPECWDPGQLYTALSRLSSIDGLFLAHHCNDSFLITSKEVLDFYKGQGPLQTPDDMAEVNKSKNNATVNDDDQKSSIDSANNRNIIGNDSAAPLSDTKHAEVVPASSSNMKPHKWTEEEESFILNNPNFKHRALAEKFNVSMKSIERKIAKLRRNQ